MNSTLSPFWTCLRVGTCSAALLLGGCKDPHAKHDHEEGAEKSKLVVSRPLRKDTVVTRDFV